MHRHPWDPYASSLQSRAQLIRDPRKSLDEPQSFVWAPSTDLCKLRGGRVLHLEFYFNENFKIINYSYFLIHRWPKVGAVPDGRVAATPAEAAREDRVLWPREIALWHFNVKVSQSEL